MKKLLSAIVVHSVCLAVAIALATLLLAPDISYKGSAIGLMTMGLMLSCGFVLVDKMLSSRLESALLCTLTFNERPRDPGVLVLALSGVVFGDFILAMAVLCLCQMLTIISTSGPVPLILVGALLTVVEALLNLPCRT